MKTDIQQTSTGDLGITNFSVTPTTLDSPNINNENSYQDDNVGEYLTYYKTTQLKAPIDTLAIWTIGKGYETDARTAVILENLTGWGEDSFTSILFNLMVMKKVTKIGGFAEIIRNDNGSLINLKPLNPANMIIYYNPQGIITGYGHSNGNGSVKKYKIEEILHLVNDRIGDEVHGTSVVESVKWIIDAKEEAMRDWRRISHRATVRILYVEEDDKTRIANLKSDYKEALQNGNLLILPIKKGDGEFVDLQLPPIQQFLEWIRYLENLFYQAVRVPKIIATSEGFTEAGGKMGYMTFEPIYTYEQTQLESDLWNQLAIRVKFNRPPSLSNAMNDTEQKNAGQTGLQPNDVQAGVGE
jgi:hypothetical protein